MDADGSAGEVEGWQAVVQVKLMGVVACLQV